MILCKILYRSHVMVFFVPSRRFVVEIATLALAGGGMFIAKRLMPLPRLHPLIAKREFIVKHEAGIALVLSQLAELEMSTEHMQTLIDLIEQVVHEAHNSSHSSQGRISRLNCEVIRLAHQMCDHVTFSHSASLSHARCVLIAREDIIPVLESMLQNVLHNHLLSRT